MPISNIWSDHKYIYLGINCEIWTGLHATKLILNTIQIKIVGIS